MKIFLFASYICVQDSYTILLSNLKRYRIIWMKFAPRMTIIHLDFPDFFSRLSDCHYILEALSPP